MSVDVLLPAAPNWYGAHVFCGNNDKMAFASKDTLTLVEWATRRIEVVPFPCRVIACCASEAFICGTGSDHVVRAFTPNGQPFKTHQVHTVDACAIQCTDEFVISGDNRGLLVIWDLQLGRTRELRPSQVRNQSISALSLGPRNTLAVGMAYGLVAWMDWESEEDLHCLARHVGSIRSLHWRGEILACSSNSLLQVWSTVDWSTLGTKHINEKWASIHVVDDGILYTKNGGEVMLWNLESNACKKLVHEQSRSIFGLFTRDTRLAVMSMDRSVVHFVEGKVRWRLFGIGGHCSQICNSHLSIAVASGDGNVRLLDLMHLEHRDHVQVLWKNLMSDCTALASHKSNQHFWAYGLSDGSFGLICRPDKGAAFTHAMHSPQHTGRVKSLCFATSNASQLTLKKSAVPGDVLISVGPEVFATVIKQPSISVAVQGEPLCVCSSPTGWYIACKQDTCTSIMRMEGLECQEIIPAPFVVSCMAAEDRLILGSEEGELFDGKTWKGHKRRVTGIDILDDRFISMSADDVKVWRQGECIVTLPGVAACWDRTRDIPAVVYGGSNQIVYRWSYTTEITISPVVVKRKEKKESTSDTLCQLAWNYLHQSKANEFLEIALEVLTVSDANPSSLGSCVFGKTQKQAEHWHSLETEKTGFGERLLNYWIYPEAEVADDVRKRLKLSAISLL